MNPKEPMPGALEAATAPLGAQPPVVFAEPMKTYRGTKTLLATPMTRGGYNAYRGWLIPSSEDASEQGYLVEYTDGGKANDSRHAGYISWSPKDVFERAYQPVRELQYQQRVVEEKADLDERQERLRTFMRSPKALDIADAEKARLYRQLLVMGELSRILGERIAAFGSEA